MIKKLKKKMFFQKKSLWIIIFLFNIVEAQFFDNLKSKFNDIFFSKKDPEYATSVPEYHNNATLSTTTSPTPKYYEILNTTTTRPRNTTQVRIIQKTSPEVGLKNKGSERIGKSDSADLEFKSGYPFVVGEKSSANSSTNQELYYRNETESEEIKLLRVAIGSQANFDSIGDGNEGKSYEDLDSSYDASCIEMLVLKLTINSKEYNLTNDSGDTSNSTDSGKRLPAIYKVIDAGCEASEHLSPKPVESFDKKNEEGKKPLVLEKKENFTKKVEKSPNEEVKKVLVEKQADSTKKVEDGPLNDIVCESGGLISKTNPCEGLGEKFSYIEKKRVVLETVVLRKSESVPCSGKASVRRLDIVPIFFIFMIFFSAVTV